MVIEGLKISNGMIFGIGSDFQGKFLFTGKYNLEYGSVIQKVYLDDMKKIQVINAKLDKSFTLIESRYIQPKESVGYFFLKKVKE